MKRHPFLLASLVLALSTPGFGAPLSGKEIAEKMQASRLSDGFSARMNVAVIESNGRRQEPFKLSLIGQRNSQHQRLLLRGISPARLQQQRVAAELRSGKIVAVSYQNVPESLTTIFDADEAIFDSGLRLWDMFAPWWNWPEQQRLGTVEIRGQSCELVHSTETGSAAFARSVVSCVDTARNISLRTEIFGPGKSRLRTIEVLSTMRRDSGAIAAKKLQLEDNKYRITESEIYSGDENYEVSDALFSRLNATR
jgi:hypothetical protein